MIASQYRAAILDLDGVITQTARLHAQAWKQMFDAYLEERGERAGEDHAPFDARADYDEYVDGKPRYDGVRSFLASRGIELPEGHPDDPPGGETICGLGNRKNEIFHELLDKQGVDVYDDAVEQINRWRERGLRTAVISSSRNCEAILEAAGLRDLFDVKVDGVDSERLGLEGKPAPDIFVEAARQLDVGSGEAMVFEDARAGVEAGRAGEFGLVVGVVRDGDGDVLSAHGADIVVQDLRDADELAGERSGDSDVPSALNRITRIAHRLEGHRLALFTDYDGTLTPIVERPEEAVLSDAMRALLRRLSERVTVAVISGRDLDDVRDLVQLDELYYAGSHGFDIAGPGEVHMQHGEAQDCLPHLDAAERCLRDRLREIDGARVERKRFAIAVHYRQVAAEHVEAVEQVVDGVLSEHDRLRKQSGKKIFELQPDVPWDKGQALHWLLDALDLGRDDVLPVYLGDDTTDEDAFLALDGRGVGICVGVPRGETHADFLLRDVDEVKLFLRALLERHV